MLPKLIAWLNKYREVAFDLIRIYLGVGLFVRGVLFAYDGAAFAALLPEAAPAWLASGSTLTGVSFVHVLGGGLIALGLWTRLAALVQIPVLFGAVFLSVAGLFSASQSFELSALVLFLLLLVFVCGSGRWSVDHYRKRRRAAIQLLLDKLYDYRAQAFDLLRIYLGIALFLRGILFIADAGAFMALLAEDSGALLRSTVLLHYVALAHIFGGFMMTAGLLTRVAALIQIPILMGAVLVTDIQGGLTSGAQGFEIAALTLFLLIVIFLYGSGKWSSDYYLFKRQGPNATRVDRTARAAEILTHAVPADGPLVNPIELLAVPEEGTSADSVEALRQDPHVTTQARYSFGGWCLFLLDVTPRPREIVFRDVHSGQVIKRSKDPTVLQQFKYR